MIVFPESWDGVDPSALVGDYITLPDGNKKLITLQMHQWAWWKIMHGEHPDLPMQMVRDAISCIAEVGNVSQEDADYEFAALLEEAIVEYATKYAKAVKGIE